MQTLSTRLLFILVFGASGLCSTVVLAQDPSMRVSRISGSKSADQIVITRNEHPRILKVGDAVQPGDLIVTQSHEEVELMGEDSSKLLITENSQLQIETHPRSDRAVFLKKGKLAGAVVKSQIPVAGKAPVTRYRFMIRTKTAVMGVRGTQFVVDADGAEGKSTFHVIEGVVDVAKNLDDLVTDNFVVVKAGQFVEFLFGGLETAAEGAKKVTVGVTSTVQKGVDQVKAVMPYDVTLFLADLNKALPEEFHVPFITGEEPHYRKELAWFHLSSLEIYSGSYFSYANVPTSEQSLGFGLSWNPTIHLISGEFDVRGHIGIPKLFQNGSKPWDHIEAKILGTVIIKKSYFLESGPAYKLVRPYQGSFGLNLNGGIWFAENRIFHILDRIFFGITWLANAYPDTANPSSKVDKWEYRFGAGFTIF